MVRSLRTWVPTYIAELERQASLPARTVPVPPDPLLSYRAGLDFDTWEPAWSPVYIVVAQPTGEPIRADGAGAYIQQFDVQVACNFQLGSAMPSLGDLEEDSSRQYADILGMAAAAAVLQHGSMGRWPDGSTVSDRTWMSQYPRASFPFPDMRHVVRSEFALQAMIADVVTEADGPRTPPLDPYTEPPDYTIVTSSDVTVVGFPPTATVPAGDTPGV